MYLLYILQNMWNMVCIMNVRTHTPSWVSETITTMRSAEADQQQRKQFISAFVGLFIVCGQVGEFDHFRNDCGLRRFVLIPWSQFKEIFALHLFRDALCIFN